MSAVIDMRENKNDLKTQVIRNYLIFKSHTHCIINYLCQWHMSQSLLVLFSCLCFSISMVHISLTLLMLLYSNPHSTIQLSHNSAKVRFICSPLRFLYTIPPCALCGTHVTWQPLMKVLLVDILSVTYFFITGTLEVLFFFCIVLFIYYILVIAFFKVDICKIFVT